MTTAIGRLLVKSFTGEDTHCAGDSNGFHLTHRALGAVNLLTGFRKKSCCRQDWVPVFVLRMQVSDFAPGTRFFLIGTEPYSFSPPEVFPGEPVLTNWDEGLPTVVSLSELEKNPPIPISFEYFSDWVKRMEHDSEAKRAN